MSSYLLSARRTPIGKLQGALASVPAPQLAARAIAAALGDSGVLPEQVDEVVLGNVLSAGIGQAPARQAALAAGLPPSVGAATINKVCGSGLYAVLLADRAIRCGEARVVVAGGMESMSRAPHLLLGARGGWKLGHQQALDSLLHDGLWCAAEQCGMGELADATAERCGVSRADQDALAAESHRRAVAAAASGKFAREFVPLTVSLGKQPVVVDRDEGPREGCSPAELARLRPAFGAAGTATAGNASQISDGAAAVVVAHEEVARSVSPAWRARIVAAAVHAGPPRDLFVAPVGAIERVLRRADLRAADIDLWELNEAFAGQVLACSRPLRLDLARVNVHGGAIALGHPIGASGARVLTTLLHALADRQLRYGLAALCLGGGEAVALLVERQ